MMIGEFDFGDVFLQEEDGEAHDAKVELKISAKRYFSVSSHCKIQSVSFIHHRTQEQSSSFS